MRQIGQNHGQAEAEAEVDAKVEEDSGEDDTNLTCLLRQGGQILAR